MYRHQNLHFRFSADTCTSTFVTANIFPWYLLIRENFANEAVLAVILYRTHSACEISMSLWCFSEPRVGLAQPSSAAMIRYHRAYGYHTVSTRG